MLITQWSLVLRRLSLVLGLYAALRLFFLVYNRAFFTEATAGEIALAFLHGLRFDLAATAATNIIFVLLCLLPRQVPPTPGHQRLLKGVFLGVNVPFLLINAFDLEYFRFNGRRSTVDLLSLAGDAGVKWLALVSTYWVVVLLGAAMAAMLWIFYGRAPAAVAPRTGRLGRAAWALNLLAAMTLGVIAVRGGLQSKPIGPADAATLGRNELAQLALNSSLTVIKSYRKTPLRRYRYMEPEALLPYLRATVDGEKTIPDVPRRDNIVILILESFSAEYWGVGNGAPRYTPFLDSLAEQSLFLSRNYANGRRSRDAVPAILVGLPALMPDAMLESLYATNDLVGLGTLLTPLGYTTSFFHGATTGTMHFDILARIAGIQHYFGLEDYPDASHFDGNWGVFDEPYLQYVARELSRQKPPFAAVIFTITSHNPYPIPDRYRGRFNKGTLPIHETIGYTDHALQQFFATARRQPWFADTLFVITADHTEKLETPEYQNALGLSPGTHRFRRGQDSRDPACRYSAVTAGLPGAGAGSPFALWQVDLPVGQRPCIPECQWSLLADPGSGRAGVRPWRQEPAFQPRRGPPVATADRRPDPAPRRHGAGGQGTHPVLQQRDPRQPALRLDDDSVPGVLAGPLRLALARPLRDVRATRCSGIP
jgi:phosphoglycerol transferase MdoB-like AlkP superfamily enzyme